MQHLISKQLQRLVNQCSFRECTRCTQQVALTCLAPNCRQSMTRCLTRQFSVMSCKYMSTSRTHSQSLITPGNILQSPLPDLDVPTNQPFHQFIFDKCDEYKDQVAVQEFLTGKSYTYREIKENSIKVASALHKLGYRKGDIVVAFSTNNVDFTLVMLACSAIGVWFSTANPAFTAGELARQLNDTEAKAVFAAPAATETVKDALASQEFPNKVKNLFVFGESPGFQPFQTLLDDDGKSFPDVDINPTEDVLTLPYSSGTTGLPKGVMLTHHNCQANCLQTCASLPLTVDDRCIGLLPLYHIYGLIVVQFTVLVSGANVTYLPKFEPETFLSCLQDRKITMAHLVPPLAVFLAKHPLVSKYDITSVKRMICGAAPLGADVTKELLQRHHRGLVFNQAYGMTELSPVSNIDTTQTMPSIGPMVANTLGKVVDPQTNEALGPYESGELCVKGPQMMKGYFKNQKATDEMIDPEGWLHTGDVGYFNENGFMYITDRLKELIKYKGSQVAPAELEALMLGSPEIQDVAVIGVPDERAGELPKAFVVKKPGSNISEDDIIKFVEEQVSDTKRLRGGVQFVDEIPKNPSGKILRRVIKANYL